MMTTNPISQTEALRAAVQDGLVTEAQATTEAELWATVDKLAQRRDSVQALIALLTGLEYEEGNPVAVLDGEVTPRLTAGLRDWMGGVPASERKYLLVNSGGGSAVAGVAAANLFRRDGNVTVSVHGQAFSAASLLMQGASQRLMTPGSVCGIHRTWMFTMGNAKALRAKADMLDAMDDASVEVYRAAMGDKFQESELLEHMEKETLFSAEQTVAQGLADEAVAQCPTASMRLPNAGRDDEAGDGSIDRTQAGTTPEAEARGQLICSRYAFA